MKREVRIVVDPNHFPRFVVATFYQDGEVFEVQACDKLRPLESKIAYFLGLLPNNSEEFLEFLESKGVCFWWQNPETKEVFDLSVGDSIFETIVNEFRERKLDSS